jgi:hypothetical protein
MTLFWFCIAFGLACVLALRQKDKEAGLLVLATVFLIACALVLAVHWLWKFFFSANLFKASLLCGQNSIDSR